MRAQRIVLWRHGRTAFNQQLRFQGQIDIPLDEVGLRQAATAADVLARYEPDAILCSDLDRAQATAIALAERTELPVAVDHRLRERSYGKWEGHTAAEIAERWPRDYALWRSGADPEASGVETRRAAGERAAAAMHDAVERTDGTLVVVSHGGLITCALTIMLGQDPVDWQGLRGLSNCHWSILAANPDRTPAWRLAGHNIGLPDGVELVFEADVN